MLALRFGAGVAGSAADVPLDFPRFRFGAMLPKYPNLGYGAPGIWKNLLVSTSARNNFEI